MTPASPKTPRRYDTLPSVSKGTALQSFRIDDQLWQRFAEVSAKAGTNRSAVLRDFIRWYIGDPDAALPERPDSDA